MPNYITRAIQKMILAERSPHKLALSFCFGNMIAWSPTIPFQTPLILVLCPILGLKTTVSFITLYIVSNPVTILPIYVADYLFGVWFLTKLGIPLAQYNPSWAESFSAFLNKYVSLEKYLGSPEFYFWGFICGGIILPIATSIIIYPFARLVFGYLVNRMVRHEVMLYQKLQQISKEDGSE